MDVVNGEQARDFVSPGHGRNQSGHPVVAVDDVRFHPWDDVVDHLPLKCQGHLEILIRIAGIDTVFVKEHPVHGKMNPFLMQAPVDFFYLLVTPWFVIAVINGPVVGYGYMNIAA